VWLRGYGGGARGGKPGAAKAIKGVGRTPYKRYGLSADLHLSPAGWHYRLERLLKPAWL